MIRYVVARAIAAGSKSKVRGFLAAVLVASLGFSPESAVAISDGVTNATMKTTGAGCASCHGATEGGNLASVTISGPTELNAGQTATYTVTATQVTPNSALKMGVNIAASDDTNSLTVPAGQQLALFNGELKHVGPNASLPTSFYQFNYTMPAAAAVGTTHTLYATAAIGKDSSPDKGWRHAPNFVVTTTGAPPPADPPRLGNVSTRMQVLTGNDVLIGGFVVGGSSNKTVVVRARGPSLIPFGITNALANPQLQLVRSADQSQIASNDDWQSASNAAQITASGFAPSNNLESAILVSLPPGAYTAIVTGVANGTGVGIVEVFEVDAPSIPLTNISTRGQVLTGNDVMIGGFVVSGNGPQTVVVRARGPSLIPFGITNALANPHLQLVRSSDQSTLATNDDWQSASNAAQITASGFAPSNNLESAILMSLQPGAYTAIVTGVANGTGVGIFEVFVVP